MSLFERASETLVALSGPVQLAHPMRIAVIPGDGIGKDVTAEAL